MRILEWAVGTFAFYGVGMVLASFVWGEIILPLSTAGDRFLLILCGLAALAMIIEDKGK